MSLSLLLSPRSIAVVGASENAEKIGGRPLRYMRECGYEGRILPINPGRETVQGLPAFASLDALPEAPDAVVIAVPGPGCGRGGRGLGALGREVRHHHRQRFR